MHKEIFRYLETLNKIIEGYSCSDDLKIETWVCNPFLADTHSKSMIWTLPKVTSLTSGQGDDASWILLNCSEHSAVPWLRFILNYLIKGYSRLVFPYIVFYLFIISIETFYPFAIKMKSLIFVEIKLKSWIAKHTSIVWKHPFQDDQTHFIWNI